ncbi:hypothetical protein [Burkholderia ambifaria]|uniref:hypothetical protein n=1 Tax=Burkholderia ambifaria TaxID=152480 RepID=UPI002FDF932A
MAIEGKPLEARHVLVWRALPEHKKHMVTPEHVRAVMEALGDDGFMDEQLKAIEKLRFKFTGACHTVKTISVGLDGRVGVVGDPENAAYEWVVVSANSVKEHSDCAYGSPEIALRDGLIAALGLPDRAAR